MLNFGHNCAVKICSQERLLLFTPIFSLPMGGPPIPTFCLSLPAFASHSEFLPPDLHITRWVGAHLLPPLLPTPIFCLPFLPLPSFSSHISTFFQECGGAAWPLLQTVYSCRTCGHTVHGSCLVNIRRPCVGAFLNRLPGEEEEEGLPKTALCV